MYKVYDVARQLGISHTTIYRALKQKAGDGGEELVQVQNGCKFVTEAGLAYLRQIYKAKPAAPPAAPPAPDRAVIDALLEQLREKDRQLAEKDKQLAEKDRQLGRLIEQARNFQILLRSEQNKQLPAAKPRPGLLDRILKQK